jgi:hypothetical protein
MSKKIFGIKTLFPQHDKYLLFIDESGTAELSDKSDNTFILNCLIVERDYYKNILV